MSQSGAPGSLGSALVVHSQTRGSLAKSRRLSGEVLGDCDRYTPGCAEGWQRGRARRDQLSFRWLRLDLGELSQELWPSREAEGRDVVKVGLRLPARTHMQVGRPAPRSPGPAGGRTSVRWPASRFQHQQGQARPWRWVLEQARSALLRADGWLLTTVMQNVPA